MAGKYLTFMIGSESYGIPVLKVREIIRLPTIIEKVICSDMVNTFDSHNRLAVTAS